MHHLDLTTLTLKGGGHDGPESGMCLLEAVSYMAGEPWSDAPQCVDVTLAAFGRSWNDGMRSDDERAQLKPYVPVLVGTAGDGEDASRRAWMALDWSVRVSTPTWLDLAGLADHAERLRRLPEVDASNCSDDIDDPESKGEHKLIKSALDDARRAGDAAWAAARAAARAVAWAAAGDAARAAAWAAARAVAGDAARAVAWAAAGDAARAVAWAAARAAAWDALAPTVTELQRSAHDLYRRMIAAGPHDAGRFAALPEVVVVADA